MHLKNRRLCPKRRKEFFQSFLEETRGGGQPHGKPRELVAFLTDRKGGDVARSGVER